MSLAYVRGIRRWQMDSPHKRPVTRKTFPFDDVTMRTRICYHRTWRHHSTSRSYAISRSAKAELTEKSDIFISKYLTIAMILVNTLDQLSFIHTNFGGTLSDMPITWHLNTWLAQYDIDEYQYEHIWNRGVHISLPKSFTMGYGKCALWYLWDWIIARIGSLCPGLMNLYWWIMAQYYFKNDWGWFHKVCVVSIKVRFN